MYRKKSSQRVRSAAAPFEIHRELTPAFPVRYDAAFCGAEVCRLRRTFMLAQGRRPWLGSIAVVTLTAGGLWFGWAALPPAPEPGPVAAQTPGSSPAPVPP